MSSPPAFLVVFDLTSLAARQALATPAGIDRVALAYARHLLDHHAERTVFARAQGREEAVVVDRDAAAALVSFVEGGWGQGRPEAERLAFQAEYGRVLDPDIGGFFELPFARRFEYLLGADLRQELGPALAWLASPPLPIRVLYALLGAASARLCRWLIRAGGLVGQLRHGGRARRLLTTAFRGRGRSLSAEVRRRGAPGLRVCYVNVSHLSGVSPDHLRRLGRQVDTTFVFMVHDLLPIHCPEYFVPGSADQLETRLRAILGLRPVLLVNSRLTQRHLLAYGAERGLEVGSVIVAPPGVDGPASGHRPAPPAAGPEADPHFVVVSTIEPRKNHLLLLHLWRELAGRRLERRPRLYVVGQRGWENEAVVDMLERCPEIGDTVCELADLDDAALAQLLARARALLSPSFYEGWGLPVAEALSLGTPVICADIPALREAGQGVPDYLHPLDGTGWLQAVLDYCDPGSPRRAAQLQRLEGFAPPTWAGHFSRTLARLLPGS